MYTLKKDSRLNILLEKIPGYVYFKKRWLSILQKDSSLSILLKKDPSLSILQKMIPV